MKKEIWVRLVTKWRDETGLFHKLNKAGKPSCNAKYYASSGPYPGVISEQHKCKNCMKTKGKSCSK